MGWMRGLPVLGMAGMLLFGAAAASAQDARPPQNARPPHDAHPLQDARPPHDAHPLQDARPTSFMIAGGASLPGPLVITDPEYMIFPRDDVLFLRDAAGEGLALLTEVQIPISRHTDWTVTTVFAYNPYDEHHRGIYRARYNIDFNLYDHDPWYNILVCTGPRWIAPVVPQLSIALTAAIGANLTPATALRIGGWFVRWYPVDAMLLPAVVVGAAVQAGDRFSVELRHVHAQTLIDPPRGIGYSLIMLGVRL